MKTGKLECLPEWGPGQGRGGPGVGVGAASPGPAAPPVASGQPRPPAASGPPPPPSGLPLPGLALAPWEPCAHSPRRPASGWGGLGPWEGRGEVMMKEGGGEQCSRARVQQYEEHVPASLRGGWIRHHRIAAVQQC